MCSAMLFISLCLPAGDGVPLFVVDDWGTMSWKKNHLNAFRVLQVEDRVRKAVSYPYSYWTTHPRAKYMSDTTLRGFVTTVNSSGQVTQNRFSTLPSPELFAQHLTERMERLKARMPDGVTPTISKHDDITTISNPKFEMAGFPGSEFRKWEVNYRFSDPLLMTGVGPGSRKSVASVSMRAVKRLTERAKGHNWYLLYRPDEVSEANRGVLLQSIITAAAPGLQQRDDEDPDAYAARLQASKSQLELLRQLLNDVEQVVASTTWPSEDRTDFRGQIRLTARQGTPLAAMLNSLKVSRGMDIEPGSVGRLNVAVAIPKVIRPVIEAMLTRFQVNVEGLSEGIRKGKLTASVALDLNEKGHLAVRGVSNLPASDRDVARYGFKELQPRNEGIQFDKLTWRLRSENHGTSFVISDGKEAPGAGMAEETRDPALLDLNINFKPIQFAAKGSPVLKAVHNVETVYIRKKFFSPIRLLHGKKRLSPESLTGLGNKDGDWTLKLRAEVVGNTLRVDWIVGQDLHALYRYRTNSK